MSGERLWSPSEMRVAKSEITRFMSYLTKRSVNEISDYEALWSYSVSDIPGFWRHMLDFTGIIFEGSADPVLVDEDKMPGAVFFPGIRLNYAENALKQNASTLALDFYGEDQVHIQMTYAELSDAVSRIQKFLKSQGVGAGDRVAGYLPNMPQTIVAMLATTSLGAIWSSGSPDFGVEGITDRFGQVSPSVVFACDGYFYGGKSFDIRNKVRDAVSALPTVRKLVIVPYTNEAPDVSDLPAAPELWSDILAAYEGGTPTFKRMPFNDPLYIMFSSGTTGRPKCITHGIGGTLLQHRKEHMLHADVKAGDRLFYFTTCGWMMWNWLVSGMASGATLVLYDGNPFYPDANAMFDLIDRADITHFGTSAKAIDAAAKAGIEPIKTHKLVNLQSIFSTGSPLLPESFDYVYRRIKKDVCLSSISGGTDIVSCFVLGCPILPVHRGEIQCRGLGMAADVFGDDGMSVTRGEKGELVCTKPFPSMPVGFWGDKDGSKYREAYFDRYPNIWHHGDYVKITETGGVVIFGRSDATLNPGGVRIGTAEIYRQVEKLDAVLESIVIGQPWDGDVRVILFVRLKDGITLTEHLITTIKTQIRNNATPRHVPAHVVAVTDIPRTRSGKITEIAVRDVVMGLPVTNQTALANPEALKLYKHIPELQV